VLVSAYALTQRVAGSASKLMPVGLATSSVRCMPGQLRRRWSRIAGRLTSEDRVDAALAVFMALVATVGTLAGNYDGGPMWLVIVTGLLITMPLAVRRRFPGGVYCFVLLMIVLESALSGSTEGVGVFFGLLVSTYTLAAHRPLRPALADCCSSFPSWRSPTGVAPVTHSKISRSSSPWSGDSGLLAGSSGHGNNSSSS
jgi:hypothetical protein